MTILTTDKIGGTHRYLARNCPDWQASMTSIQGKGGPWYCAACDGPSYLCYRCSRCGCDLTGDT